jgi:hypothetical protein
MRIADTLTEQLLNKAGKVTNEQLEDLHKA